MTVTLVALITSLLFNVYLLYLMTVMEKQRSEHIISDIKVALSEFLGEKP